MQTLFHGTSSVCAQVILAEGLRGMENACAFVTDCRQAAEAYARARTHNTGGHPVVLEVTLPEFDFQPNGSVAPPFFADDWHRDSMPGNAWEYDAPIDPEQLAVLESGYIGDMSHRRNKANP